MDVRSYLDGLIARGVTPGLQYVLVDAEGTRASYAGGLADIRSGRPMTPATTMMAYSMTKTVTALAVLRLVDAGHVGLDDEANRYIPGSPYGTGVTVRRLLSHTAGLPNPIPLRWVHLATARDFDERAALSEVLRRHPRLASEPGLRFRYSNLGYWLLGPLVEAVRGRPFTTFVADEILTPLVLAPAQLGFVIPDEALHASGYLEKYSMLNLVKRLVIDPAYIDRYDGRWLRLHHHYVNGPAFGGLVGTAAAFGRLLQENLGPTSAIVTAQIREWLAEPQATASGMPVPMTLGWHLAEGPRGRFFYKEGGGGGFHSMMRVYPAQGLASVMMVNATGFDVGRALDRVDTVALA
jgi:D-alanyl-D-alanine carboxypeptidase